MDPNIISATSFQVENTHTLATSANSDISMLINFPAPDTPLYVWGLLGTSMATPVNGNISAGPQSDFTLPFEVTVVDWYLTVPSVPEGTYSGTIVLTIFN